MHSSADIVARLVDAAPETIGSSEPHGLRRERIGIATAEPRMLRRAGIAGLGTVLPPQVISSDDVAERIGVPSGWLERRTGIHSRRHAAPDARVSDLAVAAGRAALADADVDPALIDLILVATFASDELTPNTAPIVANELGATTAGAIDIGAACTGFISALTLGSGLIEAGRAQRVLVIGAEIMSRWLNHEDRSTAGLFGDGAGAVVLAPTGSDAVVGHSVLGSDGSAAPYIVAPRDTGLIEMDGHETFKRAVTTLAANALETVTANGLAIDDIDLFVLHQANGRILTAVAETLGVPAERVLDVIAERGNTSAASIPLALADARERGQLEPGNRVLLGAVGAGFTWGATVVEWGRA
jgi:3-oxoacyl-[acyl-carrier-protein] synthase-3